MGVFGLAATGVVASSGVTASAGTKLPTLDNMLCVNVRGTGFHKPIDTVDLQNAIQPVFFTPNVIARTQQCNPVNMATGTGRHQSATYIKNPKAHLLCWGLTYSFKAMSVKITNKFGTATMSTGSPASLCLPTWSSFTKTPTPQSPAPAGLDQLTCYPLSSIVGFTNFKVPSTVTVQPKVKGHFMKVKVKAARQLCVPTTMTDNNVQYDPQSTNDRSLTCFSVSKIALAKRYYDLNVFGAGTSRPTATSSLCLSSTIQVEGPTT